MVGVRENNLYVGPPWASCSGSLADGVSVRGCECVGLRGKRAIFIIIIFFSFFIAG